jgi:hypothetical protein
LLCVTDTDVADLTIPEKLDHMDLGSGKSFQGRRC